MPDLLSDLVFDHTLRTIALGAAMLGIVSGALGTYAVLRRQSLLGDAMSHAALPGIACAFLLTGSKRPFAFVVGAALAAWVGTLLIMGIVRATRLKYDTALGLVLSVFFGFGLVVLTFIQRQPEASQAGLDRFLFGHAASLLERDLVTMGALGALALVATALFWKEFKLLSFDPDFGGTLGLPMRVLDVLLTGLLVVAIVVGLQTVGVVLMSAMIVAPAAAARQWTDRLGIMFVVAGLIGAAAGVTGAVASSAASRMPTGPTIVVTVSGLVVLSILFAPNRGLVWGWARDRRARRRLRVEAVLADLQTLAVQHGTLDHGHSAAVLSVMRGGRGVDRSLRELEARGWARRAGEDEWSLTRSGRAEAEKRFGEETSRDGAPA